MALGSKTKGCKTSFDDFFNYFKSQDGLVLNGLKGNDRIWLCDEDNDFLYCCLITNLGVGGGTTLDLQSLKELTWHVTDSSVNFRKNLMVISKAGKMGLYQSQSETFPMSDLNSLFIEFSNSMKTMFIKVSVMDGMTQEKAEENWPGHYFSRSEMTNDDFVNLVTKMKSVHDFSWLVDVAKNKGGFITPLMRHAKRNSGRITFNPVSGKMSGVRSFIKSMAPSKARVEGLDENGVEAIYYLQKKYEVLASHKEEEWKRRWNGKSLRDFNDTDAIRTMTRILNSDKPRFMEVKDDNATA